MEDVSLVSKPWEFGFPDQWPGDEESSTPDDGSEFELPAELSAAKADAYATLSREQRLLIERARQTDASLRGVRALMKHLPESGEELDQIFEHLVAHRDQTPFATLWAANLAEGRPADSRHFVGAINLLPHVGSLIHHIAQLRGDVAANALAMLWERQVEMKMSALTLLLVVLWCQECRERQEDEPELAPRVLAHIRHLVRARLTTWKKEKGALQSLYALLSVYQEPSVLEILEHHKVPVTEKDLESGAELLAELRQRSILDYLPDRLSERMVSGGTVQRTAEKVGRNDACPCGSGKKYKKCCEGQEQPFQQEDVSAPTQGAGSAPAPCAARLTQKRLLDLSPRQVYELEFGTLPERMRGLVLARLFYEDEHQRMIEHACSLQEDMDERTLGMLYYLFHHGILLGKSDLVRGLAEAVPKLRSNMELPFALFLGEEPAVVLEAIEADARLSILGDKPVFNVTMVTALLYSERYPALGVLLARAVIACSDSKAGKFLLHAINRVLDLNHWNPIDRAEDLLDQVQRSEKAQSEIEDALAKAKSAASEEVEAKRKEIRRLQWELKRTRNTLTARQKEAEADSEVDGLTARTVPETSTPLNGKRLREVRELRDRCARLQEELRDRHSERNEMLRTLQQAQESLSPSRKDGAPPAPGRRPGADPFGTIPARSDEDEEHWLDDDGALPNWPVRFPVWPPEIREQHKIPDAVWRSAVQLSGRLAAGDPSAIQGVKLLKGLKGIFRQRVAGSWRLMFEVTERELRIVDLVPRRDLIPWARDRASR